MKARGQWWLLLVWLGVSAPAFWVLPAIDDWGATAPLRVFDWARLGPGLFWRPFEMLNRMVVGRLPSLYPQYLHLLAVVGHGLSAWLVQRLVRRLGGSRRVSAVAAALFLVHPGVSSVVWSVDGSIRAWSTACGLASVEAYFSENRRRALFGWLFLGALAALWYEPGLRWFFVAPLLREVAMALRDTAPRPVREVALRVAAGMTTGLLAFGGYFLLRWSLTQDLIVSGTGRYAISFQPLVWLRNAIMLGGVSSSTVDTLALLGPSPSRAAAAASLLLGLPLLVVLSHRCTRTWPVRAMLFGPLALLVALAPHLPQAHVSEFYAHSVAALVVILLAGRPAALSEPWATRSLAIGALLFVTAALAVDAHKAAGLIRTGRVADGVGRAIVARLPEPPEDLCVVMSPTESGAGYSVFAAPPGPASEWGYAARGHWGWDHMVRFSWVDRADACPAASDAVIVLSTGGEIRVVRGAPRS